MSSSQLTVGSPDANGKQPNMSGDVTFKVMVGNPATPAVDEADVSFASSITDVRLRSNLSDYAGQLQSDGRRCGSPTA